ncbi:MAG: hypothetical protein M5R36_17150 [Deltaproteobacteria bacterium]|nr:hypothetical protein [Deltaproteobacteria bacterium]
MTRRFLCLAMLALLAVSPAMLAMTCNSVNEGQGAAGIASDTLYDDSLCEIPGEGLAAVIGYLGLGYCERLGLELDVDAVYGSADKRVFELRGTFGTAVPRTFFSARRHVVRRWFVLRLAHRRG